MAKQGLARELWRKTGVVSLIVLLFAGFLFGMGAYHLQKDRRLAAEGVEVTAQVVNVREDWRTKDGKREREWVEEHVFTTEDGQTISFSKRRNGTGVEAVGHSYPILYAVSDPKVHQPASRNGTTLAMIAFALGAAALLVAFWQVAKAWRRLAWESD